MRYFILPLIFLVPLIAQTQSQDQLPPAQQKLQKALEKLAALPSCAFDARWGPYYDANRKHDNAVPVFIGVGKSEPGKATGSWDGDDLLIVVDDYGDELRYCGRRMLARQKGTPWSLRRGNFADGNMVNFAPDPQQLIHAMTRLKVEVTHRDVGSLFDRPVEILSVTLTKDQVIELRRSGLLPSGLASSGIAGILAHAMGRAIAVNGAAPARVAQPEPESAIDLAFFLEPGNGLLRRIVLRSYTKENHMGGMGIGVAIAINNGGNGGQVELNADDDDEDGADKPDEPATQTARIELVYEAGLPKRTSKKMTVFDFMIDLHEHGTAKLPPLDDAQKELLGSK